MIWIFAAILTAARLADIWTSSRDIFFGGKEANPLWRDQYGHFSVWKNALASAFLITGLTVVSFFIDYGWAPFIPFAVGSFLIAWLNWNAQKKSRVKQIEFLGELRRVQQIGGTEEDIVHVFQGRVVLSAHGRVWFAGFAWLWTNESDDEYDVLIRKIAAFAMSPDFPK